MEGKRLGEEMKEHISLARDNDEVSLYKESQEETKRQRERAEFTAVYRVSKRKEKFFVSHC